MDPYSDAAVRHYHEVWCKLHDDAVRDAGLWRFPSLRWADYARVDEPVVLEPRDGHKPTAAVIALRLYRDGAVTLPASWH